MADRRIVKTDRAIYEALLSLSETMSVSRITVAALSREADITRKTFYDHFDTVIDAYRSMLSEIVDRVAARTHADWDECDLAEKPHTAKEEVEARLKLFLAYVREEFDANTPNSRKRSRYISREEQMVYLLRPFTRSVQNGLLGDPSFFMEVELAAEFVLTGTLWMLRKWTIEDPREYAYFDQDRVCKLIMDGLGGITAREY